MKKLNIAVVGAGIYGKNHLDAYTSNPNVNLVAVCDLKKEITDKVEQDYQVKTYNDMEEMLKSEEIDAISVATPDPYHKDPVMTAIRYGKDVLVEKPLATTSADAYDIIEEMCIRDSCRPFMTVSRWEFAEADIFLSSAAFLPLHCWMSVDI